jgi:hypothetical protein
MDGAKRIGEALALKAFDFTDDFRVLHVTRSIWHGREQDPPPPPQFGKWILQSHLLRCCGHSRRVRTGICFPLVLAVPSGKVNRAAGVGVHAGPEFLKN